MYKRVFQEGDILTKRDALARLKDFSNVRFSYGTFVGQSMEMLLNSPYVEVKGSTPQILIGGRSQMDLDVQQIKELVDQYENGYIKILFRNGEKLELKR